MPVKNLLRTEITNNFEKNPVVEGRIVRIDSQEIDGPKGVEIVPYILVDSADRFVRVYKSAALEEAFGVAKLGHFVRIESVGMRTTKRGMECRQFDVRVWEDTDAPAVDEVKIKARRGPLAEEPVTKTSEKRRGASGKAR